MQRQFTSLVTAAIIGVATLSLATVAKADVTGTYKGSRNPVRDGGNPQDITIKLKQDGEKLTGTLIGAGRGGQTTETEIKDGKVKGNEISFTTSFERGGNTVTTKWTGKISGDTIEGKSEAPGRDGGTQSRGFKVKKEEPKK